MCGPERVAEDTGRVAEHDRRFALPSLTVGGVEGVDVQAAAVAVRRAAAALDRVEAVHGHAVVEQAPEQIVCLAAKSPVSVHLELGEISVQWDTSSSQSL